MKPVSSLQHQPRPASIGPRSSDQVVAVEVEAGLEPQRVARAEAGRGRRRPPTSASHTVARVLGRDQQLDAVLARVAGAADEHAGRAGDRQLGGAEAARAARRRRARPTSPRASGPWTASIAKSARRSCTVDVEVRRRGARNQARSRSWLEALVTVRKRSGAEAVGEEVVEHAAVLAAEHRVLRAAVGELARRRWRAARWRNASAPGAGRLDLAHVRDVEDARAPRTATCSSRMPGVLDRHLPAGERHEPGARGHVAVVQRGALERLGPAAIAAPDPSSGSGPADAGDGRAAGVRGAPRTSTTTGSNCVPAQRRSSSSACLRRCARRAYGRPAVIASKASATATMRAPSGIASPASRPGSRRRPSARGWRARARPRAASAGAAAMMRSPMTCGGG